MTSRSLKNGVTLAAASAAALLAACGPPPPPVAVAPDTVTVVRVDTVVVTREVMPPAPDGRAATLCLATGQSVDIRISPAGDTLVGPRRVAVADLGPGLDFIGTYATAQPWFARDQNITLERRQFSKFGQPSARDCRDLKIVGAFGGVNLFADVTASAPFQILYVPASPGIFQPYQAQVGRVRG